MNLTNWVYWAIGLVIGIAVRALWNSTPTGTPTATAPPSPSTPEDAQILDQLKQTKLAYLMASEMTRFKGGFLARVSHELRAPLNGIIGTHQLILTGLCDSPDEEKEFLNQASESALKLVRLMDKILVVAKVEHGTEEMKIEPVCLAEVFDELEDLTFLLFRDKNLKLQILMPHSEMNVLADRRRLSQALVSLVDQSLQLMNEGSVTVSASVNSDQDTIDILIDTPCPLVSWNEPIDFLEHLPAPQLPINSSFQLSPGMALLMSQILFELMGGKLELISLPAVPQQEAEMSRFKCLLPRYTLSPKPDSPAGDCVIPLL